MNRHLWLSFSRLLKRVSCVEPCVSAVLLIFVFVAQAMGQDGNPDIPPNITTNVDARIAGKNFATAAPLWSKRDDASQSYVWNKNSWLRGVNMTCVSPWNSVGGGKNTVTLITPDAVVSANHYNPGIGTTVRFVGPDNLYYSRTITAASNPASDIWIGLLDSPLPASITPAKCLPADFPLPTTENKWRAPICGINQNKMATVCDFAIATPSGQVAIRPPINPQRRAFFTPMIVGDSGSPFFFIINNEPILLGCWWSSMSGPSVQYYQGVINDALTKLGSKYKLKSANF